MFSKTVSLLKTLLIFRRHWGAPLLFTPISSYGGSKCPVSMDQRERGGCLAETVALATGSVSAARRAAEEGGPTTCQWGALCLCIVRSQEYQQTNFLEQIPRKVISFNVCIFAIFKYYQKPIMFDRYLQSASPCRLTSEEWPYTASRCSTASKDGFSLHGLFMSPL